MDKNSEFTMKMEQVKEFEKLAIPLVNFLNENFDPHTKIMISQDCAELLSTDIGIPMKDYIKD